MPDFEPGDVVRVPFPYTDGESTQHRPALVVACPGNAHLLWVLMITSAANRPWPEDLAIADLAAAGLPAASVVRTAKITTIDARRAERRGRIGADQLAEVRQRLKGLLALAG